jgi:coenzyme F420-reducing hydrogenase delta subunit
MRVSSACSALAVTALDLGAIARMQWKKQMILLLVLIQT